MGWIIMKKKESIVRCGHFGVSAWETSMGKVKSISIVGRVHKK